MLFSIFSKTEPRVARATLVVSDLYVPIKEWQQRRRDNLGSGGILYMEICLGYLQCFLLDLDLEITSLWFCMVSTSLTSTTLMLSVTAHAGRVAFSTHRCITFLHRHRSIFPYHRHISCLKRRHTHFHECLRTNDWGSLLPPTLLPSSTCARHGNTFFLSVCHHGTSILQG
jgi:hypothetical protein